jgi:flavin reductase (DIM6/NTAB) family NADH-FMN oxidoreductase RutF
MKGRTDQTLHEVLRQMPYGLHVLGVRGENGQMNACVVSWVMQCSFFPPLLLVAIRKPSRSYDLISSGKAFTINLVNKEDEPLVRQMVKPSDMVGDKLYEVAFTERDTGAPVLERAYAYIECNVREIREPGDHALVIGDVVHAAFQGHGEAMTCADVGWHYGG